LSFSEVRGDVNLVDTLNDDEPAAILSCSSSQTPPRSEMQTIRVKAVADARLPVPGTPGRFVGRDRKTGEIIAGGVSRARGVVLPARRRAR
jgi:hypothetical protein